MELCVELRWPDGAECPRCGAGGAAVSPEPGDTWRCRNCRRRFTITTGTAMHASKLPVSDWVLAARARDDSPGSIRRIIGCSYPTARRVSAILGNTERMPGRPRLTALLTPLTVCRRRSEPGYEHMADDLTRAEKTVLGVLRAIPEGVTTGRLAETSFISQRHARRCLAKLAGRGWVGCETARVRSGYGSVTAELWSLPSEGTGIEVAWALPWRPLPGDDNPETVPHEFWWQFWSGDAAHLIKMSDPESALRAAGTLVAGPDCIARQWALMNTPLTALRTLRTMRGYDDGSTARIIDTVVEWREQQLELI